MRVAAIVGALSLIACRPKDAGPAPVASSSTSPSATPVAIADAAPEPEKPLTWGTRPGAKGPFFPIVDGMCIHGEIWPVGDRALFTYGNQVGAYSKGSHATMARLEDEGLVLDPRLETAADPKRKGELGGVSPMDVRGTWPDLVLYSNDRGAGRLRIRESLWKFGDGGWTALASSEEKDEPNTTKPVRFKGWLVAAQASRADGESRDPWVRPRVLSWPLEKDAPPIPGLSQLVRAGFHAERLEVTSDSIYAFGQTLGGDEYRALVRVLTDGKVVEAASELAFDAKVHTSDHALIGVTERGVSRYEGPKRIALPFELEPGVTITGSAVATNGDVWITTSKHVVMVLHDGKVTETPLPAPASPKPKEAVQHWPSSGSTLAGVEFDDPWAVGATGSLFHFENGKWSEVELPEPPFATVGKYQAQALVMRARGDLYVNAGYAEKGPGWKTPERYRAVLRQKRPREVLRCNEPLPVVGYEAGEGFSSSPPIANDACPTPFAVLLRLGPASQPNWLFDRKSNYPGLRKVIKETPGLGASVDIVEFPWNGQVFAGVRAPTTSAARELALATAKRVTGDYLETRPEVVCGLPPKIDKTISVDVATGNAAAPIGSAK